MNILNIKENCLVITLSRKDLDIFGLTYETLDYSSDKTKALIRLVLDKAADLPNTEKYTGRGMLIEALPDTDGGCLMFFTFTNQYGEKQLIASDEITLIAESPDIELICRLACAVNKMNAAVYSSLFRRNEKYRLMISAPSGSAPALDAVVGEFALPVPKTEKARTQEYWKELISENAVDTLAKLSL